MIFLRIFIIFLRFFVIFLRTNIIPHVSKTIVSVNNFIFLRTFDQQIAIFPS